MGRRAKSRPTRECTDGRSFWGDKGGIPLPDSRAILFLIPCLPAQKSKFEAERRAAFGAWSGTTASSCRGAKSGTLTRGGGHVAIPCYPVLASSRAGNLERKPHRRGILASRFTKVA
jgi:hypothetical protein